MIELFIMTAASASASTATTTSLVMDGTYGTPSDTVHQGPMGFDLWFLTSGHGATALSILTAAYSANPTRTFTIVDGYGIKSTIQLTTAPTSVISTVNTVVTLTGTPVPAGAGFTPVSTITW